ncbi:MAG TPA: EAL domain-containing protein [Mycobacteriales bacterium]|nr:EAL domain-containing protein [Mycobacteriales bacterium]
MKLPLRVRALVIGVAVLAAGLAGLTSVHYGSAVGATATVVVLGALVCAAWVRPLLVYRGRASEGVQADEGLVLLALVLLPARGVLLVVGVAVAVGQTLLRRLPPVKATFNLAQVLVATSCAVLLTHALGLRSGAGRAVDLAIGLVGVVAFSVISASLSSLVIAASSDTTMRSALLDGIDLRAIVLGVGCLVAAPFCLAIAASSWAIALLPPVFAASRFVVTGQFAARHDRDRLLGLFDATLAIHRPLVAADVRGELTTQALDLLRCSAAELTADEPAGAELASPIAFADSTQWLAVSGRSRTEPFDAADQRLLDALAAVGGSSLSHAELYAQSHRQSEELTAIMRSLAEGVVAFDDRGRPIFVNAVGAQLLGLPEDSDLDSDLPGVTDVLASIGAVAARCVATSRQVTDESSLFLRRDGTTFPVSYTCSPIIDGDEVIGAALAFRDITERLAAERELAHHAFHDQLTGLPNRRLFLDRLDQALRRGTPRGSLHTLLFIDVDRFKNINDNLGHAAGDQLLQEIARRITAVVRPADTVARFGGDEFTVLVEDVGDVAAAQITARRVHDAMATPVQLGGDRSVVVTLSIGIAGTDDAQAADDLLHNADVAMYQAKAVGVGGTHRYDGAAMRARSAHGIDVEADLRDAISRGRLEVYYQPLIDLQTGVMGDVEALIRWPDPERGMRMPGEFIPIAEESGLILPLGRFVFVEAAKQALQWQTDGVPVSIAVNLSARQFQDRELMEVVASTLEVSGLPPERMCLEITETLAMQDMELTLRTLNQLKGLGVRLAIDDFGTGYSSLSYLKRFPVDEVKIDQSFVRELRTSNVDRAIIQAVVGLADAMDIMTVVEGIEDEISLRLVRDLGCKLAQGYHVARPHPATDITPLLHASASQLRSLPSQRAGDHDGRAVDIRSAIAPRSA